MDYFISNFMQINKKKLMQLKAFYPFDKRAILLAREGGLMK
jgi:hypothetical protein